MALIGEIRKNSWLLIILIGLGLLSFIMMDMFSGDKSMFGGQQANVGTINGKNISWNDFNTSERLMYRGGNSNANRQALWDYYVEESLLQEEAKALGLSVGRDELLDLQFGAQKSPIILNGFRNPQTGQLNQAALDDFKQKIETDQITGVERQSWALQEDRIVKDRLQTKLATMISKGMYTPTWMVEKNYADQGQKVNFDYVKIPFSGIADSDVSVSDADLNSYLSSNIALYSNDVETRKLDYVVFDVKPTAADSNAIRTELLKKKDDFLSKPVEELAEYLKINSGNYQDAYYKKSELGLTNSNDLVFNAQAGTVVGPFAENNAFSMIRVLDKRVLPDSARSRHILISAQTEEQFAAAEKTVDSLKSLLVSRRVSFDTLAVRHSQDPGSATKGGVYENVGINQFVPEFRDIIFHKGQIGQLYSVRTSYGVHLIEPLGRTKGENSEYVKVALMTKAITPSSDTQNNIYQEVYDVVSRNNDIESLRAAAEAKGLIVQSSEAFKHTDFNVSGLGNGDSSRKMIKWAFEKASGIGNVSPDVLGFQDEANFYTNKYVACALKTVQAAGTPALANIRDDIMPMVMNQKKAELLKGKITGQNLANVASSYGASVENVAGASFQDNVVSGLGNEPKIVAAAAGLSNGQVSAPVVGDSGIFVVQSKGVTATAGAPNTLQLRKSDMSSTAQKIQAGLMKSIKENANIEDNRSIFY